MHNNPYTALTLSDQFGKSGTPKHIFAYHGLDGESIAEACGQALSEMALEQARLDSGALALLQGQQGQGAPAADAWKALWPEPQS